MPPTNKKTGKSTDSQNQKAAENLKKPVLHEDIHPHLHEGPHPYRMREILISATPLEREAFALSQSTSMLDSREINRRMAPSIGDMLSGVPGVASSGYAPGASRPVIRGQDNYRVNVLQNGLSAQDVSALSPDHPVAVNPFNARKVEIIRGPATLMYGATSNGGVVNIMDGRVPTQIATAPATGELNGRVTSGNFERSGALLVEGGTGNYAYHMDGALLRSDDFNIPGYALTDAVRDSLSPDVQGRDQFKRLLQSDIETKSYAFGNSYVWDKGYVGVAVSHMDTRYGIPNDPRTFTPGEPGEEVFIQARKSRGELQGQIRDIGEAIEKVDFRAALSDYYHFEIANDVPAIKFENAGFDARAQATHRPCGPFEGAFGFQIQRSMVSGLGEEIFLLPSDTITGSFFFFEEAKVNEYLRVQFGARMDHQYIGRGERSSLVEQELTPEEEELGLDPTLLAETDPARQREFTCLSGSVGVVWNPDEKKEYAVALSMPYTERAPQAEELFANGPHEATRQFFIGNGNLDKETSVGVDLSLRKQAGFVTGSVGGFFTRYNNFITPANTGMIEDNLPVFVYTATDAEFYGAEADISFHLLDTKDHEVHLEIKADYTVATDASTGRPLPRIPPLRLMPAIVYQGKALGARVGIEQVFSQDRTAEFETATDGYTFVNAEISYRLTDDPMSWEVVLFGRNLTDAEGRNHLSFLKDVAPLQGRYVGLSARMKF